MSIVSSECYAHSFDIRHVRFAENNMEEYINGLVKLHDRYSAVSKWTCSACTFENTADTTSCAMCGFQLQNPPPEPKPSTVGACSEYPSSYGGKSFNEGDKLNYFTYTVRCENLINLHLQSLMHSVDVGLFSLYLWKYCRRYIMHNLWQ